ncbi:HNH endonuclease [Delftia tsuruhatensis]|uniref:HNH endonuclease n=1 Tax=Delftia tsuruhatensis TaxID=180282 RepID=UPI0039BCAF08
MAHSLKAFKDRISRFSLWLAERGAQVQATTNEWELIRFKSNSKTSIVYRTAAGALTFTGEAEAAWKSYLSAGSWRGCDSTKRSKKTTTEVRSLLARDGDSCFLCGQPLGDDITVEHLVAVAHGGPNHLSNKALMHRACNVRVSHLSVAEKVRMRDSAQNRSPQPPTTTQNPPLPASFAFQEPQQCNE